MRAKPRGSVVGLKKNREDLKVSNTAAMMSVIAWLRIEKPTRKWTYKEVWSRAGLKSQIALDSAWNAHVRAEIEAHNARIRSSPADGVSVPGAPTCDRDLVKSLREELRICKNQRDQALSRIAQFAADAEYFKKQCEDFKKIAAGLRSNRAETSQ
ncbi:hypothetical protein FQZ97_746570 [compost metagenome]